MRDFDHTPAGLVKPLHLPLPAGAKCLFRFGGLGPIPDGVWDPARPYRLIDPTFKERPHDDIADTK
jgi:hypothetical protein